ncbi:MAG: transposase [Ktedonobacteraceae bacterium]|nr:transposase [Ktedonobacteraceae bacterium]
MGAFWNWLFSRDHVYLFLRSDPYTAPSDIARLMKGRSSRVLREEFPELLKLPSL